MSKITLAGLDERTANERLCAWLNERDKSRELTVVSGVFSNYYIQENTDTTDCARRLFNRDHTMIHHVLDAMTNRVEQLRYLGALKEIFEATGENYGIVEMLLATPFQKCEAALLALELGKP